MTETCLSVTLPKNSIIIFSQYGYLVRTGPLDVQSQVCICDGANMVEVRINGKKVSLMFTGARVHSDETHTELRFVGIPK